MFLKTYHCLVKCLYSQGWYWNFEEPHSFLLKRAYGVFWGKTPHRDSEELPLPLLSWESFEKLIFPLDPRDSSCSSLDSMEHTTFPFQLYRQALYQDPISLLLPGCWDLVQFQISAGRSPETSSISIILGEQMAFWLNSRRGFWGRCAHPSRLLCRPLWLCHPPSSWRGQLPLQMQKRQPLSFPALVTVGTWTHLSILASGVRESLQERRLLKGLIPSLL